MSEFEDSKERYPWELDAHEDGSSNGHGFFDDDEFDDDEEELEARNHTATATLEQPLGRIPSPPMGGSFGKTQGPGGMKPVAVWIVAGGVSLVVLLVFFGMMRAFTPSSAPSRPESSSSLRGLEHSSYSAINSLANEVMATPDVSSASPLPSSLSSAAPAVPQPVAQSYSQSTARNVSARPPSSLSAGVPANMPVPDLTAAQQIASQVAGSQMNPPQDPRVVAAQQAREQKAAQANAIADADVFVGNGTSSTSSLSQEQAQGQAQPQTTDTPTPAPDALRVGAGTWIPVTLLSEVNLSVAGGVVAQVREPVFDSLTGGTVLIPRYSKIVGTFASGSASGERGDIVWTLLRFPDGQEVSLDTLHSQDSRGTTGLGTHADYHRWEIARTGLLSALAAVGTSLLLGHSAQQPSTQIIISSQPSGGSSIGSQAVQPIITAANKMIDTDSQKPPTYTLSAGTRFNLFVDKPIFLQPYQGGT